MYLFELVLFSFRYILGHMIVFIVPNFLKVANCLLKKHSVKYCSVQCDFRNPHWKPVYPNFSGTYFSSWLVITGFCHWLYYFNGDIIVPPSCSYLYAVNYSGWTFYNVIRYCTFFHQQKHLFLFYYTQIGIKWQCYMFISSLFFFRYKFL